MNVLDCMKRYQAQLEADKKQKKYWTYEMSGCAGTFNAAVSKNKRWANCATIANWALRELGITKSGMYFWGKSDGTLSWSKETEQAIKAKCDVFNLKGKKKTQQAIKDGTLQAGDILVSGPINATTDPMIHTNIYAGNNHWYDAGRGQTKNCAIHSRFTSWYCTKKPNDKIAYIIRVRGPVVYRVQSGAYNKKKNADERVAAIKNKTGLTSFIQKTDFYRVYCGSFEFEKNAEERKQLLINNGFDAFVVKKNN